MRRPPPATSLDDFRAVYRSACGPIDAPPELLAAVIEAAVDETAANPRKMQLAAYPVDRELLRRIAFDRAPD